MSGGQPSVRLDLTEQEVEGDDVRRAAHLGQHDLVEALTSAAHDLDDVAVGPARIPRVHAHAEHSLVPIQTANGVDDFGTGRHLLLRGH